MKGLELKIKIDNNFELITYSKDVIGIKQGNKTLVSYDCLVGALKWLDKNGYSAVKNRVQGVLIDFVSIDTDNYSNSFITENYKVQFDGKREFIITDLSSRNNVRWIYNKKKMIEKVYYLEVNRINAFSVDELVNRINQLNISFLKGEK